jgi:hypothetical protein
MQQLQVRRFLEKQNGTTELIIEINFVKVIDKYQKFIYLEESMKNMVEKMTAVWLIILTIIVCASVPAVMIWLTSPKPQMIYGLSQELINIVPIKIL